MAEATAGPPPAPVRAGAAAMAGTAVGDAVGAPLEGAPPQALAAARAAVDRALARAPLPYTDDTQMALLLLEHVADAGGAVEPEGYVALLAERVEPWRGYGAGMQLLVARWRAGLPWREAATSVFPEGSFGNGAAMRVAPLGATCADDPARAAELARRQAEPTHAHPVGVDGAVAQARAAALAAARGRFGSDELAAVAETAASGELAAALADAAALATAALDDRAVGHAADRLGAEVTADRSVPLALWIAARAGDVAETVVAAAAAGGDTDTIAAMAAAVRAAAEAAAVGSGAAAVPARWLEAVEDGPALVARAEALAAAIRGEAA